MKMAKFTAIHWNAVLVAWSGHHFNRAWETSTVLCSIVSIIRACIPDFLLWWRWHVGFRVIEIKFVDFDDFKSTSPFAIFLTEFFISLWTC
jgi:hypothetical protein